MYPWKFTWISGTKYSRQKIVSNSSFGGREKNFFYERRFFNSSTFGIYRFAMECRNIGHVCLCFIVLLRTRISVRETEEEDSSSIFERSEPANRQKNSIPPPQTFCLIKYFSDQDSIPFSLKNPTFLLGLEETGEQRGLSCFMFILWGWTTKNKWFSREVSLFRVL